VAGIYPRKKRKDGFPPQPQAHGNDKKVEKDKKRDRIGGGMTEEETGSTEISGNDGKVSLIHLN